MERSVEVGTIKIDILPLNGSAVGYVTSQVEQDSIEEIQASSKIMQPPQKVTPEINLGLAASPIGAAKEIRRPLSRRHPYEELSEYPSDPTHKATRKLLVEGIGLRGINENAVEFVDNGSYGAGDETVRLLKRQGYDTIVASIYSFPNVSQWALRHDVRYGTVHSDNLNPTDSTANILKVDKADVKGKIFYVDYPNNPFGQVNPQLIRQVIDFVSENGGVPLIDLAFGEVLGDEFREVMQYTLDRGGICLGSLSKTQGLPGLRSGYAILSNKFVEGGYKGDERLVFGLNREAEFAYQRLFTRDKNGHTLAQKQAARAAEYNARANAELYAGLAKLGLIVGDTDPRVPIQVIISNLPDLYDRLAKQGLIVESLKDYSVTLRRDVRGYHDSAVRILTPKPGQVKEVLKRIKAALQ